MSQLTTTPHQKPWEVDVHPDFFGLHLLVDGRRFFIPKERLEAVIVALSVHREQLPIADWLDDPADQVPAEQAVAVGQQDG